MTQRSVLWMQQQRWNGNCRCRLDGPGQNAAEAEQTDAVTVSGCAWHLMPFDWGIKASDVRKRIAEIRQEDAGADREEAFRAFVLDACEPELNKEGSNES